MTKDEILSRLLSDISDEFDKGVGSFFYDVTKPASEEFETAYARLEEILKNGFALTASGDYLDFKAAEQGITRKSGVASQVKVTITGTPGSIISVGDKVASDNLIFSAIENKEISESGTADVTVICDTVGTVGNIPTGSINRFPVTLSGIVSVTNNEPATGGFDEETDDELRDRYFEKVSLPATSGSKYHYIQWAKEINGVASDELIDEVKNHIEENRPIAAEVTVESAEPLTIDVSVSLTLAAGASLETAKEKITESITKYLQKNAFSQVYISYAQIGGCILACDEIADYSDLKLNNDTQHISVSETQVPVLGVVTVA